MTHEPQSLWARCRGQRGHLDADAALAVMLDRRGDGETDRRQHAHVEACPACDAAVTRQAAQWKAIGSAARQAADEAIGPDRLARQLDVIARRLDGQPGRLLRFPVHRAVARTQPRGRRWVAMAAACGLLFGLAAGRLIGPSHTSSPASRNAWASPAATSNRPAGHGTVMTAEPAVADEYLLGEVDAALARAVHSEFQAIDELTPRSGDVFGPRR